jgi:hypothetical protein
VPKRMDFCQPVYLRNHVNYSSKEDKVRFLGMVFALFVPIHRFVNCIACCSHSAPVLMSTAYETTPCHPPTYEDRSSANYYKSPVLLSPSSSVQIIGKTNVLANEPTRGKRDPFLAVKTIFNTGSLLCPCNHPQNCSREDYASMHTIPSGSSRAH